MFTGCLGAYPPYLSARSCSRARCINKQPSNKSTVYFVCDLSHIQTINSFQISSPILSFLSSCLKLEPELRSSARSLLDHKLFLDKASPQELAELINNFYRTFKDSPLLKWGTIEQEWLLAQLTHYHWPICTTIMVVKCSGVFSLLPLDRRPKLVIQNETRHWPNEQPNECLNTKNGIKLVFVL